MREIEYRLLYQEIDNESLSNVGKLWRLKAMGTKASGFVVYISATVLV